METVFVRLDLEVLAFGRERDGALRTLTADPGDARDPLGRLLAGLRMPDGRNAPLTRPATRSVPSRYDSNGGQDAA